MGKHCYRRWLVVVGPSAASLQMNHNATSTSMKFCVATTVLLYPAFTWFYMKNKTISSQTVKIFSWLSDTWLSLLVWVLIICAVYLKDYVKIVKCRRFGLSTFRSVDLLTNNPKHFAVYRYCVLCWVVGLLSLNNLIHAHPPGMPKHVKCQLDNDTVATL